MIPTSGHGRGGEPPVSSPVTHRLAHTAGSNQRPCSEQEAQEQLKSGAMFIDLGAEETADLSRLKIEKGEIESGLALLEMAFKAWQLSATQRATEAQTRAPRSGTRIQAEFSVDLAPLLKSIVEQLDGIESWIMWTAGQMAGYPPKDQRRGSGA
jgi:hypothetical protein